jgi:GT2 family glycosyltransferase
MIKTAVVILNYNGEDFLAKFLPSVISHSTEAEIFVVDNGSTDGSLSLLQKNFSSVKVIALDKNYGFCGGYNRAFQQIRALYYVLLNSDVEVTSNWLSPMITLMDDDHHVGAIQPKILSYHDRNKFEYAGAGGGYIDSLGYPFCRGRLFNQTEEDQGQYNDTRQIFWATGACMMIRSSLYHNFSGLDENFFAHMEEIDLCWKINRTQYKVMYCGQSTVYHVGAGTLSKENPRKTFLNFRNGLNLIYKHLKPSELVYKLPLRILLDWLAALVFLLKGSPSNAGAVFNAHFDFVKHLGSYKKKRVNVQKDFPWYSKANIYSGLIIIDHFIKGKKSIDF